MNFHLIQKKNELLRKYPSKGGMNIYEFHQKKFHEGNPFVYGIVVDNKDPDCLGRVRVQMDLLSPGCVGPWYHFSGSWRNNGCGFWALPDIGTQVLVCFPYGDYTHGIVLGCIYDEKHLPPKQDVDKPNKSYLWQTKNHRIEIIDEDGKEGIYIETAKGKMRAEISKDGGIKIVNELGDIKIKCKKLTVETGENFNLASEKGTKLTSEDAIKIKTKKNTTITSDKEVKVKGKNIKMNGSKGVAAEGKQIAVQDDKVVGFDVHIMVVPAGTSTANVPLPHPFMGKLADKLSKDVKIKDKPCATKDSVAKHDDSMHMQLPGTIKFQNNPKKEGNVTGGTSSKVKINGKEAAVIGSQVTTCNDVGAQNNSTVIAPGASMPMPVIINPANTEEYEREQEEKEKKEPKFSNVKWAKTSCEEGEEVELSATVQDIEDGNMVTLMVFHEGKGPETGGAIAKFPLTVSGGSVSAKWSYRANQTDMPPEADPKFIFSAHCAWCNFEKSSNTLEVKLVRPEIKKLEWQDKDGNSASKVYSNEEYTLSVETKDFPENSGVTVAVFNKTTNKKIDDYGIAVSGDKGECKITLPYIDIKDKDGCDLYCEVTAPRCKPFKSSDVKYPGPEFSNLQWLNFDDEEIDKVEYGTEAKICAEVKNLAEGEKVYFYVYRNSTENTEKYFRKISAIVTDNKVEATVLIKEDKRLLQELGEDSEINYLFVLVPQNYPMCRSEDSKEAKLNFVFIINIYDNPDNVNQNNRYVLEDIDEGKKYQQEKKIKDDMVADDEEINLKFEELKPGLKYRIRHIMENGKKGHIIYNDLEFVDLVED